jgi:RNA polymerase sigma factor (sigma-70 family)
LTPFLSQGYIEAVAPDLSTEEALGRIVPRERDRELVLAVRRGDEEAVREVYRAYRVPVLRVVLSLVGDSLQAQDILQNVFFKVFRGLGGFRFRSSLVTWIYRIARNECRTYLRKRRVTTVPLETIAGSLYEAETVDTDDRGPAGEEALKRAVMELPFKMREVVVLKYQEDLSYDEMSRILGCPPGTVASRLNRALLKLGARLGPEEDVR